MRLHDVLLAMVRAIIAKDALVTEVVVPLLVPG